MKYSIFACFFAFGLTATSSVCAFTPSLLSPEFGEVQNYLDGEGFFQLGSSITPVLRGGTSKPEIIFGQTLWDPKDSLKCTVDLTSLALDESIGLFVGDDTDTGFAILKIFGDGGVYYRSKQSKDTTFHAAQLALATKVLS